MKLKDLLMKIDYNDKTQILLLVDNEKRNISFYKDVTEEVLIYGNIEYNNYYVLNIFMQFNTITIYKGE